MPARSILASTAPWSMAALLLIVAAAQAQDLSAWKQLPIYHSSRPMPVDSYAQQAVTAICERVKGDFHLDITHYYDEEDLKALPHVRELMGGRTYQSWESEELVLSWMAEPEKWDDVPFIYCPRIEIRNYLEFDEENAPHRDYVSPRQIRESRPLWEELSVLQQEFRQSAAERIFVTPKEEEQRDERQREIARLMTRYRTFLDITLDPRSDITFEPVPVAGDRKEFIESFFQAYSLAAIPPEDRRGGALIASVRAAAAARPGEESNLPVEEVAKLEEALNKIREQVVKVLDFGGRITREVESIPLADVEPNVVEFRKLAHAIESKCRAAHETASQGGVSDEELRRLKTLAFQSNELDRLAYDLHFALYSGLNSPPVTPGLGADAFVKDRDTENKTHPWISLQALRFGSDELLEMGSEAGFPPEQVRAARAAWDELFAAFANREAEGRDQRLTAAQRDVVQTMRDLGETMQERRLKAIQSELAESEIDHSALEYTEYPLAQQVAREVHYNDIDPFKWSWILSLVALGLFGASFVGWRDGLFWAGTVCMGLVIGWTAWGFGLRIAITQWAPVTNMYETVIFVPWVVAILGIWFLLLPTTWDGIASAWRMTAFPWSFEATDLSDRQEALMPSNAWLAANFSAGVARLGAMAVLVYYLAIHEHEVKYLTGEGGTALKHQTYFHLLPKFDTLFGSFTGGMQHLMTYLVNLTCLVLAVWLVPRVVLTLLASVGVVPWELFTREPEDRQDAVKEVYESWPFAVASSIVCFLGFWVAWYAPVLDESFTVLQPVLRSNFWLLVHVLTIVASYGAGMLAWLIGLIGLSYCLFGSYRNPVIARGRGKALQPASGSEPPKRLPRRPPEAVNGLANYAYRAVQVAVLLLAAGTILGGLWADVSWGRFWGWDPKEVWALISLLVYLAILHGRYAGWFNNFGMLAGTIIGAIMIAMSWYGVNFVLPMFSDGEAVGLHSYGQGEGGQMYVFAVIGVNIVFLIAASIRYSLETNQLVDPIIDERESPVPNDNA